MSRKSAKKNTATKGEAMTSAMLYSVTPMSDLISACQYCPRPKATTSSSPPPMARIRHDDGFGLRASRSAKPRHSQAASTPSP